jgi:hypothetical protein
MNRAVCGVTSCSETSRPVQCRPDESTGEDNISVEVRAVTQEGYAHYPDIRIVPKNKNIKMHFTPVDINDARTRP